MTTSTVTERDLPCDTCGSSDALAKYSDGHTFCFSCRTYTPPNSIPKEPPQESTHTVDLESRFLDYRGVNLETYKKYGSKTLLDQGDNPVFQVYPYGPNGRKIRNLVEKGFHQEGTLDHHLFGMDLFTAGGAPSITITEGELDAMSVFQITRNPTVSVRSSSSAYKDCKQHFDYLDSYDKIILCFDSDEVGKKAALQVAKLFNPNKVYNVKLTKYKDANDYLRNGEGPSFFRVWENSSKFVPESIINSFEDIEAIYREEANTSVASYPWTQLQDMALGLRLGEVVLLTAQEGIGKTEIVRTLEYHLLQTTDFNIGCIHLEEGKRRFYDGIIGYHLNTAVHHHPEITPEAKIQAYKEIVKGDNERLNFYTHYGSDDPEVILGNIRYMVSVMDCKFIFLDHITMLVSGLADGDERRMLDFISTKLANMVEELNFCLILVSHLNDDNRTRGSRNISKVADLHVQLHREHEDPDPRTRNTTKLMVKKNRWGATTGFGGALLFDQETFTLRELWEGDLQLPPMEAA